MLRGLDTENILQNPPSTQAVIQVPSDEDPRIVTGASSGHTTRAQIHGPQPGLYDMKYHPMDEVTAPARAAQHRRLTSGLVSEDEETYDGGSDTEDAYAEDDNDDESNTAADREDGNDSDAAGISRKDVFSLKYSLRDAPKKKMYYNQKYHPQDAAIGIRHPRKRSMTRDAAGTLTTRRGSVHKPTPTRRDTTCTDPQSIEKQEEPELTKSPSITSLASSAKDRPLVRYTEGLAIWDTKSGERFFRHDKESHYPSIVQLHSDDPTMSDLRDDYTASWRGDPENRSKAVLDIPRMTGTGLRSNSVNKPAEYINACWNCKAPEPSSERKFH
ncbi:hypothetical protein B0A49_06721 [Cryomyces minteri]|uniref:Uncharacterized protein n=1 Tax=Cryomyces minteri TaxID=331657 RepID=A0A4U0WW69_9PEZI|nr:hypothetical protein B0A49_06721 [Cryomyces minteri]